MTSLTRWDPIREMTSLRDAMNQLMEQAVVRPGVRDLFSGTLYGALNVLEQDGKYMCQVLLPGVQPDQIELTARQNTLVVKVRVPELLNEDQVKKATWLVREFGPGEFSRTVTLPKDIDGDAIVAHYDHGVLTMEIPLAYHAQPKRISIHDATSEQKGDPLVDSLAARQLETAAARS